MKTMKKVISVLMMVCILASFMTVAAYADGITCKSFYDKDYNSFDNANEVEYHMLATFEGVTNASDYKIV